METINAPIPFQGTPEQAKENFATHEWFTWDGCEYRCGNCDSKPWHEAALYECGQEPPRAEFTLDEYKKLRKEVANSLKV